MFKPKAHLVNEGLQSLLAIKASLNLGNNEELKQAFPDIVATPKPGGLCFKYNAIWQREGLLELH